MLHKAKGSKTPKLNNPKAGLRILRFWSAGGKLADPPPVSPAANRRWVLSHTDGTVEGVPELASPAVDYNPVRKKLRILPPPIPKLLGETMKQFAQAAVRTGGWGTFFGVRSSHGWSRHCLGSISTPKRSFLDLRTDLKKSLTSGIQW